MGALNEHRAEAITDAQPATPSLPEGFEAQPAYELRDASGRFSYQFSNVYGPARPGRRGLIRPLDRERSYWSVVGQVDDAAGEAPARRAISFADARRALGRHLTFSQFASELHMRTELPRLTR